MFECIRTMVGMAMLCNIAWGLFASIRFPQTDPQGYYAAAAGLVLGYLLWLRPDRVLNKK